MLPVGVAPTLPPTASHCSTSRRLDCSRSARTRPIPILPQQGCRRPPRSTCRETGWRGHDSSSRKALTAEQRRGFIMNRHPIRHGPGRRRHLRSKFREAPTRCRSADGYLSGSVPRMKSLIGAIDEHSSGELGHLASIRYWQIPDWVVVTIKPSGKCFDHGGEVWPLPAGINHGSQEGFGRGSDAHTNPGLFGQVDGEAEVLTG